MPTPELPPGLSGYSSGSVYSEGSRNDRSGYTLTGGATVYSEGIRNSPLGSRLSSYSGESRGSGPLGSLSDVATDGVHRQLFRAVQRDDVQTVQMLASLGANLLGARDSGGHSVRTVATQHGSSGVIRVLDRLVTGDVRGDAVAPPPAPPKGPNSLVNASRSADLATEPTVTQDDSTQRAAQPEPETELDEPQPARLSTKLDAYVNALDKVELLSTLTPAEKLRLAESLSTEEFGAGESIVEAGQAADCMYLLESGSAHAVKPSSSSPAAEKGQAAFDVLKTYSRGDFFGELALQSGGVRQVTVQATSFETTVLKLPRSAFQTIVATNAGAAAKLQQERAKYAEASSRLLAAARQQNSAVGGNAVAMPTAEIESHVDTGLAADCRDRATTANDVHMSSSDDDNSAADPSLAGSPTTPEKEADQVDMRSPEESLRGLHSQDLAKHERQLVTVRAQMAIAREQAEVAASRTFTQETQQLVTSLQHATQAQAAAEATARKASADQQRVEKQSAAMVAAKERDVLAMRDIASKAEDAARQASGAAAKLAEEIAHQTAASRTATEAADEARRRLEAEVREAMAAEAECAAKLQATERASHAEKEVFAAELEQVRKRYKDAEDERLKVTRAGEVALEEVRQHARMEADRLRDESIKATREHEQAVAKAQAQAEAYREALEQGKIDALKLVDKSATVAAQTKDQLSAVKASAKNLAAEVEAQKLRGIELATEATVAAAKVEEEKSTANARLLMAESERLALVAQVSEMAVQREEAEVAAGAAKDEAVKLASQVRISRTQLEAAEQAQAETELENARLASDLKEAVATQLAMEESRSIVAMEVSSSMAQISASFGSSGSTYAVGAVQAGGNTAPSSLTTSSLRWDSECVWVELFDDEGDPYYYNTCTHETTWEMPTEFVQFRRQQLQQEIMQAKARALDASNDDFVNDSDDTVKWNSEESTRNDLPGSGNGSNESPVSSSSSFAMGSTNAASSRRGTGVSPDRELAVPPPRGSGPYFPPVGVPPHQETKAATAAREAKMAAARVYAAKAAAAAARRTSSPQSPLRGPAMSPGRAEAERFQQDIRGFLRARRAGKVQHEHGHLQSQLQPAPESQNESMHSVTFGSPQNSPFKSDLSRSLSHDNSTHHGTTEVSVTNARLDAYVNALDKVELLSTLTPAEKLRLAESLSTEEFGAGESIVEAGQAADCMYLLESGSAHAVKPSSSSPAAEKGQAAFDVLKTYSRGDFFGELALQSGGVRQVTVQATSFETTVLKLPRSAFQTIVATNAGAAAKLQQERAKYAEASSRLLAAARQQNSAVGGNAVAMPTAEIEADEETRNQARELRQQSAQTVQRVFRGWKARGRVAKIQVSCHCALKLLHHMSGLTSAYIYTSEFGTEVNFADRSVGRIAKLW
eukprot:COSAG02_NODE_1556_length_11948_cov_8.326441_2_plen_1403_part_00